MALDPGLTDLGVIPSGQASHKQIEEFYDSILASSFRADELIGRREFIASLSRPGNRVIALIATIGDGRVIGGISADLYAECRVLLVGYLAVAEGYRERGVGTRLVQAAAETWLQQFRPTVVLGEVEDPVVWRGDRYGNAEARLRLYENLGARILDLPYFQPRLSPEKERVRGLLLMAFPTESDAVIEEVDSTAIACFLRHYIDQCEGGVRDAEAQALLSAAADPKGIRVTTYPWRRETVDPANPP